jgi:hypothetical protein
MFLSASTRCPLFPLPLRLSFRLLLRITNMLPDLRAFAVSIDYNVRFEMNTIHAGCVLTQKMNAGCGFFRADTSLS